MRKKTIALVIAFLLIFQYVNFAGILKPVEAAAGTISENLLTKMKLTDRDVPSTVIASVYDSVYYVNPQIRVELGQYLTLNYDWVLPENHKYASGDTFIFDLPSQFEMYGGNISERPLAGDPSVGTYKVIGNTVTLTFNNEIDNGTPVSGTLSFWNYFTKQSVNNRTEVPIQFNIGNTITIPIAPKSGIGPILKKGKADKAFNAQNITWTVDVNKDLKKITGASITDVIPAGLEFTPGSLEVYKMSSDTDGILSNPVLVNSSDYATTLPTSPANELKIDLGDINSVYRIVFKTQITDPTKVEFANTATLKGSNISDVTSTDKVSNSRGELLQKSGTYNQKTQLIDWEIKYNYGEDSIPTAVLTDLFTDKHELVPNSIQVYPVADPVAGTIGIAIPASKYNVDNNVSGHKNYASGLTGFNLSFKDPITGAYKITYQTKPVSKIYDDSTTVTNSVYSSNKESKPVKFNIKQNFLHKTNNSANYDARTVNWKIEINEDHYDLYDFKFEDTFSNGGLKLVPGTLDIKQNGVSVTDSVYTLHYKPAGDTATTSGFTIDLPNGKHAYTITYTTSYDYTSTAYFSNNDFSFINNGKVSWKETLGGTTKEKTDSSSFTPNKPTQDNGFKKGTYNATDKKITWEIGINYNSKKIKNAVITDKLESVQKMVPGSLTVHKLVVNSDGSTKAGALVSPTGNYSVSLPVSPGSNELKIAFTNEITEPYLITFVTSVDGEIINATEKTINNHALLSGTGYVTKDLKNSVTIPKAGEYVFKEGKQHDDSINWTIYINRGQSTVSNARIYDVPSKKQTLVKETFKLYLTSVDNNGNVTKGSLISPTDLVHGYTLAFTANTDPAISSDETFQLSFKNTISKPYILEYQSIIDAKDSETVANMVTFYGDGGINKAIDKQTEVKVALSGGEGNGSTFKGDLKIIKVDADDKTTKLPGATFELTRDSNGEKKTGTTNSLGVLDFTGLRYGKYTLKETNPPANYAKTGTGTYEVTINSNTVVKVIEIENVKLLGSIEITKVDTDNTSLLLAGATFELFNSANVSLGQKTTATNGKISFTGLPYGDYVLKEISPPSGYSIIGNGEKTIKVASATTTEQVKNKKILLGNLEITKVDNDDTNVLLAGATFELFNSTNVSQGQKTTATNGKVSFTNLPYGNYILKEISAPAGYSIIGNGELAITIASTNKAEQVKNKKVILLGDLEITKVDSDDTNVLLAGATFELFTSANVSLGQKTTAANGKISYTGLPYGNYVLKEISAPAGYNIIGNGELAITIASANKAEQVKNKKIILLGDLEITKIDNDNTALLLAGATFELFTSTNVSLGQKTTAANGKISYTDLPYGNYVLKEISAPAGYSIIGNGETSITISSSSSNKVTIKNSQQVIVIPTPTVAPTATPTATPTPTPTTVPTVTPITDPTPTPTTAPTTTPKTDKEKETTEKNTPIEGTIEIPDGSTPAGGIAPEHGKVTITPDGKWVYTPNPGYVGKDKFSIIIKDKDGNEEEIFFEIDVEDPPKGGIITTPDVPVLPKTGEDSYLIMQLLGYSMIAVGLATLVLKRRKTNSK